MRIATALDKIGVPGAIVTALCCLGVSAVVSVAASLGLGFLIRDDVLFPLLGAFLLLALLGLGAGWRRHHRVDAFLLGLIGAAGLLGAILVLDSRPTAYLSMALLVSASVWNVAVGRRHRPQPPLTATLAHGV